MSGQCSDDIERIANRLGFSCEHAAPIADYVLALKAGRVASFEPGSPTQ